MGNSAYTSIISININYKEGGYWSITSDDLPSLFLGGKDKESLFADIPAAIAALFRTNYEMEIEVRPVIDTASLVQKYCMPIRKANQWTAIPSKHVA